MVGEGDCSANADCVLGPAVTAADCTSSCESPLTQTIPTAATGTGTCSPGTYSCKKGDGECPKAAIPPDSGAGCVGVWFVGATVAALTCSALLM